MPFDINQFRATALPLGGARPTLFTVRLSLPGIVIDESLARAPTASNSPLPVVMEFSIRSAELPPSSIDSVQVPYFGRNIKLRGDRTYPDWRVTVLNDEDFSVRTAFETWINLMNLPVQNTQVLGNVYNDLNTSYKTNATVIQHAKNGNPALDKFFTFSGIFPTDVSAIGLDWDATNQIETFDVTFSYDYWVHGPSDVSSLQR